MVQATKQYLKAKITHLGGIISKHEKADKIHIETIDNLNEEVYQKEMLIGHYKQLIRSMGK